MICGFYAVNKYHCMNGNHCIVCSYRKCRIEDCYKNARKQTMCSMHEARRHRERYPKHPLLSTYEGMKSRCYYEGHKNYKDYGGRGIKVCDEWLGKNGFKNFVKDMGPKPSKDYSLDRINNNENYELSNCRWATKYQQMANRNITKTVGVRFDTRLNKWNAYLYKNNKRILDTFHATKEESIKARKLAEKRLGIKYV